MTTSEVRPAPPTEYVNPRTTDLDLVPTAQLVALINDEDQRVATAVSLVLPTLADLVDVATERLRAGGQVHYFGAGTSGRLGVLDAAELPPTFGVGRDLVVAHQAGGAAAVTTAVENAEDDASGADAETLSARDVAVGLTASGRTPYVGGALRTARRNGAATALVTSNPEAPLADYADYVLAADTGPEALTGSTRLKAGTAQKMILNTFSTALMVRLGRTFGNLMVDMVPSNAKLRGRSVAILEQATDVPAEECAAALHECGGELTTALVLLLSTDGRDPQRCREAIAATGSVRAAIRLLSA